MSKPLVTEIIRAPGGTMHRTVPLSEVGVPDLWPIVQYLEGANCPEAAAAALECWHLCHDLLRTLRGEDEDA